MLSSIGGKDGPRTTPALQTPQPQREQKRPNTDMAREPTSKSITPSNKRRAEDALSTASSKAPRISSTGSPRTAVSVRAPSQHSPSHIKQSKDLQAQSAPPHRGNNRPVPAPVTQSHTTEEAPKQAKKGSYKEIMARAQATQAKGSAVGVISHKPKDKKAVSYKKELKFNKQAIKDKKLGIKDGSRPSSSDGKVVASPSVSASGKKAPQPTYQGMAKPQPKPEPSYKGTMITAKAGNKKVAQPPKRRANEYAATDDELDEEDDEGDGYEDGYGSEESDDMEAGFSDVQQEESSAAKAARKEDEEEARLEAKLKNEKEERRKKLEQMAKKAKPQRY